MVYTNPRDKFAVADKCYAVIPIVVGTQYETFFMTPFYLTQAQGCAKFIEILKLIFLKFEKLKWDTAYDGLEFNCSSDIQVYIKLLEELQRI